MVDTGLLIGMAQIGITIGGFGAVASSLAARAEQASTEATRLVLMLIYSLIATVAALAPVALSQFQITEEWAWRGSAMFVLAICVFFAPMQVRRARRHRAARVLPLSTLVPTVIQAAIGLTGYVLCAFNLPAGNLNAPYLVGVCMGITTSITLLFRITYAMLQPAKPD
jgi:MFS family permease